MSDFSSEDRRTCEVQVRSPQGLHARPADGIVQIANRFDAEITISRDGECVDAKSILSLLTLAASQGVRLEIAATGADAEPALEALVEYFEDGFGELAGDGQDGEPVDR